MALPIPELPPVTMATFPFSVIVISSSLVIRVLDGAGRPHRGGETARRDTARRSLIRVAPLLMVLQSVDGSLLNDGFNKPR